MESGQTPRRGVPVYPRAYGVDAGTIAAGGNGSVYPRAYGVDPPEIIGIREGNGLSPRVRGRYLHSQRISRLHEYGKYLIRSVILRFGYRIE